MSWLKGEKGWPCSNSMVSEDRSTRSEAKGA